MGEAHRSMDGKIAHDFMPVEAILELVDSGVIVQDSVGKILFMNKTALSLINTSLSEFLALTDETFYQQFEITDVDGNIMPVEEFPNYKAYYGNGEFENTMSIRNLKVSADPVWLHVRAMRVPVGDDGSWVLVSFMRDITERRHFKMQDDMLKLQLMAMSRTVDAQRRRLDDLINTIPALIFEGAGDPREGQRIVYINHFGENLLGYSLEEWNSAPGMAFNWIHPDDREYVLARASENFTREKTEPFEFRMISKSGEVIWFEALTIIIYDDANQPIGARGIMMDISARKKAEDELRRSNEDLEHLAAVASHDLQEPLRMITSFMQLLRQKYHHQLDPEAHEFINYAVDGAGRMRHLVTNILHHSRIQTNQDPFVPVKMNDILAQVLRSLEAKISEVGAVVTHDDLPEVKGNAYMLEQLLQNLISNALKFNDKSVHTVHIGVKRDGARWLFMVKDNGIGIEPEFSQKIFGMFQRLNSPAVYSGSGIGLATCKKIVDRHQGRIWVESQKGEGATFYFSLPTTSGLPA